VESAAPTYPSKKLFEFVQISRPTLAKVGRARAHPCPTVAMPLLSAQQLDIKHIVHIQCLRQMPFLIVIVCVFLFLAYLFRPK